MAHTIVTKNSSTASSVPSAGSLVQGELAVNVTDKKLFTKDSGGSVIILSDPNSYQTTLVSGTNIKTINSSSILGSGNLTVGGLELLGTLTTTSGTTQTLSGLTLTTYTKLYCTFNNVGNTGTTATFRLTSTSGPQLTTVLATGTNGWYGTIEIDLINASFVSSLGESAGTNSSSVGVYAGPHTYTTSSTSVTFAWSTGSFDSGTIKVYGVK